MAEQDLETAQIFSKALKDYLKTTKAVEQHTHNVVDLSHKLNELFKSHNSKLITSKQLISEVVSLSEVHNKTWQGSVEQQVKYLNNWLSAFNVLTSVSSILDDMGLAGVRLNNVVSELINPINFAFIILAKSSLRFKEIENSAENIRKEFGFLRNVIPEFEDTISNVQVSMRNFGVQFEDVNKAAIELISNFGGNFRVATEDILKLITSFERNIGLSNKGTIGLIKNFMGLRGESKEMAVNFLLTAQRLQTSYKNTIPFNKVLEDVASASDDTLAAFRASPKALLAAAVEARKLGISLETVSKSMQSMLDFENSINKEMELSILLGRNINLQKLRELSFLGDGEKFAKELNNQIQKLGGLENKNAFQIKSMADALGISVGEIRDMVAQRQLLNSLDLDALNISQQSASVLLEKVNIEKELNKLALEEIKNNSKEKLSAEQLQMKADDYLEIEENRLNLQNKLISKLNEENTVRGNISRLSNQIQATISKIAVIFEDDINYISNKLIDYAEKINTYIDNNKDMINNIVKSAVKGLAIIGVIGTIISQIVAVVGSFLTSAPVVWFMSAGGIKSIEKSLSSLFKFIKIPLSSLAKVLFIIVALAGAVYGFIDRIFNGPVGKKMMESFDRISNTSYWKALSTDFIKLLNVISSILTGIIKGIFSLGYYIGSTLASVLLGITQLIEGWFFLFNGFYLFGTGNFSEALASIGHGLISIGQGLATIISGIVLNLLAGILSFAHDIAHGILSGFMEVGDGIKDLLIKPFIDAADFISDFWIGKSPSKLALGIYDGIASIQTLISESLMYSFVYAFEQIKTLFQSVIIDVFQTFEVITDKILERVGWLLNTDIIKQFIQIASGVSSIFVKSVKNVGDGVGEYLLPSSNLQKSSVEENNDLQKEMLNTMKELVSLIKNGNIKTGPIILNGKRLVDGITETIKAESIS